MPKESVSGNQPISKSQLRKRAKKGPIVEHGGICSKCGQKSSSCLTGSAHLACAGFSSRGQLDPLLSGNARLADRLQPSYHTADGSPYDGKGGVWISHHHFERECRSREDAAVARLHERAARLASEKHVIVKDGKFVRFENGFGEPIN